MGVYVKDATAPKNCTGCIAVHYYMSIVGDAGMLCEVTGLRMDDYYSGGRPDWCPLVDVPEPHGRLGDFTVVEAKLDYIANLDWNKRVGVSGGMLAALEVIEDAPTIIPESEKEE